jgi:hypothetical protein
MFHRLKRALLTLAAVLFLVEAWLWDKAISVGHWVIDLLPWRQFKDAMARLVDRLPPYGAMTFFLIPLAVVEPLKIVAVSEIARGHFFRGAFAFLVLKFVGLGLVAFIFDLTRDKLLSIDWFARFYNWVVKWRDKAHDFIEPYKAQARALVADLRAALDLAPGKGGFVELLTRLRARVRKAQG